jgi:hypothetical protein
MTAKTRADLATEYAANLADNTTGDITPEDVRNAFVNTLDSAVLPEDDASLAGLTLSGQLEFSGTGHAGVRLNVLTTAQRDGLTPSDGMLIYNSDEDEAQLYTGSWEAVPGDAGAGLLNVVEDTSPQSGGDWDNNGFNQIFDDGTGILDSTGNEILLFQDVSTAVNYAEITNAATGSGVSIGATGSDTNVDMLLTAKGSGVVKADGVEVATISGTQTLTNKTISGATNTISNLAASAIASGTLVHERGGLEADVSAYSGLVKITGGVTSAVTAPTGTVVGTSDTQTLANKSIDAAANTIINIGASEVEQGLVNDLVAVGTPGSGDKFMIYEAGVGLRKIDWDDMPGAAAGIASVADDATPQAGGTWDWNGFNQQHDDGTGITDDSSNEFVIFQKTASAVNYFDLTNAATGSGPIIGATGSDTNVDLLLTTKGSGIVQANGVPVATLSGTQTLTAKTIDADDNTITNLAIGAEVAATAIAASLTFASDSTYSIADTTNRLAGIWTDAINGEAFTTIADPGSDQGYFWDDSASTMAFHSYGAGLTMTTTTLAVNFFTPASGSTAAAIVLAEDTDNGAHTATLIAPASLAGDIIVTLPSATGTLQTTTSGVTYTAASGSSAAAIKLAEDTDNGAHITTLISAAALAGDITLTLPDTAGTLALTTAASTSAAGIVELATGPETTTGTSTSLAVTPGGLAASVLGTKEIGVCVFESDEAVVTGNGTQMIPIPFTMNGWIISGARAVVHTFGVTNTTDVMVRRRRAGADVDVLSTPITLGVSEYTVADGVINTSNDDLQTGDALFIDVDAVHTTPPNGLSVIITVTVS